MTAEPPNANTPPDWGHFAGELRCPTCRYNLRGLPHPRCPECGTEFDWQELIRKQGKAGPIRRSLARLHRALQGVPVLVYALILVVIAWTLRRFVPHDPLVVSIGTSYYDPFWGFFAIAWFIPAALRRRDWLGGATLVVAAVGWFAFELLLIWPAEIPLHAPVNLVLAAAPLLLLAFIEGWRQRKLGGWEAAWIAAGACAVGVLILMLDWWLRLWGWSQNSWPYLGWQDLMWAGRVVLTWLLLPLVFGLPDASRLRRTTGISAIALGLVAPILAYNFVLWPLAYRSLKRGTPFSAARSLWFVFPTERTGESDRLWRALESSDWTASVAEYPGGWDWRKQLIARFASRNAARTADRLSALLMHHPTFELSSAACKVLIEQDRWETVPILMRHMLAQSTLLSCGERDRENCASLLAEKGVPQAALAIMRYWCAMEAEISGRQLQAFELETRVKLAALLGRDVGTSVYAWFELYDDVIDQRPSPLPIAVREETDRVIGILIRWYNLSNWWAAVAIQANRRAAGSDDNLRARYLSVAGPDWNVVGTDALEREVDRYAERVEAAIRKYGGTPSAPQTQPATRNEPGDE